LTKVRLLRDVSGGDPAAFSVGARDLRLIRICIVWLFALVTVAVCYVAAAIVMPTAIAILLALLLSPVATLLERLYFPTAVAAIASVLVLVSLIFVGVAVLAPALADWVDRLPEIARAAERKLEPLREQLSAVERVSSELQGITETAPRTAVKPAVVTLDAEGPLTAALRTAPEIIATGIFIIVLTMFLIAYRESYYVRLILLPRTLTGRLRAARVLRDIRQCVSGYLFVLVCINIGIAIVTTIAFTIAGIPDPVFWGFAFGAASFLPVIGPTTVILAAAVFGFATEDTVVGALTPPLILLVIDIIESQFITPWLVSRRIVTSPIAILLAVAFFAWLWGPLASVAAVPGLILFHTIAKHFSDLDHVSALLNPDNGRALLKRRPGRPNFGTLLRYASTPVRWLTAGIKKAA
jgi:predicted PurR-regulated permease PerM